jgi:hypothetical protein
LDCAWSTGIIEAMRDYITGLFAQTFVAKIGTFAPPTAARLGRSARRSCVAPPALRHSRI